jgi:perosamine synthetase
VPALERRLAGAFSRAFGVAVSSGTAALDVAIHALGLGPGDEVLVPSLTIISCARAIVAAGATPVPVDCDGEDWNAHLRHFDARVTSRTRAVLLVHLYGLCADLDPVVAWAKARALLIVEDASQAQGLRYKGRPCGSFGDVSTLSLYANKLITTGEGGMVLCDSAALAERCRSLRNLGFEPARRFWHRELGWNYRMTALQAALGLPQVDRLDDLVRRKRALGEAYHRAFEKLPGVTMAPADTPYAMNVFWVFGLVVAPDAPFTRDEIVAALGEQGIGTRTFFYGLHEQPALLDAGLVAPVSLPVTEALGRRGFYLPSGLGLSDQDQARVIDAVTAFVERRT